VGRRRRDVLLVHYADLKTDLPAEMRRIASFLGISVSPGMWPGLIEAAGFDRMRRDGAQLMGSVANLFAGGSTRFFHQGTNGRWRGVLRDEDLATYDAKLRTHLSAACITWLEHGSGAGSPPADRAG
jgi:aryl sulfotransferase